jgi:hypothetical protein
MLDSAIVSMLVRLNEPRTVLRSAGEKMWFSERVKNCERDVHRS